MLRADLDTLQRVRSVLAEARDRGLDPAEALDHAGLLDFPDKTMAGMKGALVGAARALDSVSLDQLAKTLSTRIPATALDAKQLVVRWIDHLAGQVK